VDALGGHGGQERESGAAEDDLALVTDI